MARLDDRLRRDLERAGRPADPSGVYEGLIRRRERRRIARKVQVGALAFVVIAGTAAGVYGLSRAFRAGTGEQVTPAGPQNGSIVFSNVGADGRDHLFAINPDGTGLTQLTDFRTNDRDPTVSPDGRTIAFAHELDTGQRVIASIPITGGAVTWLTEPKLQAGRPAWSPDGNLIAFSAGSGIQTRIFVMRSNGTGVRQLTEGEVFNALDPTWSPDGSQVAFMGTMEPRCGEGCETGLRYDLFQIDIDGSDLVNLTQTPDRSEVYPSWSPDGNVLAISVGHPDPGVQGLYLIDPHAELHESRIVPTDHAIDAAWSPDGEFLVFEGDADPSGKEFDSQLWIVRPDGSDLRQVTVEGGFGPAWQPLPEVTPSPTESPLPEGAEDIGLGVPVCFAERLGRIDFLGDGTDGNAWIAVPVTDDGTCPESRGPDTHILAVDHTGDRVADSWIDLPFECWNLCTPFDATDFDGNGTEELIVVNSFSIMDYSVFAVRPGANGDLLVEPILVAAPGHEPAGISAGEPLRIDAGGDAGYSSSIECEGYPSTPLIVWSWSDALIESDEPTEVHVTRIELQPDGLFHVIDTNDFTVPAGEPSGIADPYELGPECGVDWYR